MAKIWHAWYAKRPGGPVDASDYDHLQIVDAGPDMGPDKYPRMCETMICREVSAADGALLKALAADTRQKVADGIPTVKVCLKDQDLSAEEKVAAVNLDIPGAKVLKASDSLDALLGIEPRKVEDLIKPDPVEP
jgi:hypothetical protein